LTLTTEEILMGFTMHMGFDYSVSDSVTLGYCDFPVGTCVSASFNFGFFVGLDAGLRLPASVELEGPDVVEVGEEYTVNATLTGEAGSAVTMLSVFRRKAAMNSYLAHLAGP
jgi:hypothetical protein